MRWWDAPFLKGHATPAERNHHCYAPVHHRELPRECVSAFRPVGEQRPIYVRRCRTRNGRPLEPAHVHEGKVLGPNGVEWGKNVAVTGFRREMDSAN